MIGGSRETLLVYSKNIRYVQSADTNGQRRQIMKNDTSTIFYNRHSS